MITSIITKHTPDRDWLPAGYSTRPPADAPATLGADAPGFREYGGADRSKATDGAGVRYKAICAWKDKALLRPDEEPFGFRIFFETVPGGPWAEVIYWGAGHVFCSGRGEINVQGGWIAALPDGTDDDGDIPGWVSIPTGGAPGPPGPPGPGGYVKCVPSRAHPSLSPMHLTGGRLLDMAALFGTPPTASAYVVRFVIDADAPDVRGRLGPPDDPVQCTVNTQGVIQEHGSGKIVNAGPGGAVWLSIAPDGAPAYVWLTVAGYFVGEG